MGGEGIGIVYGGLWRLLFMRMLLLIVVVNSRWSSYSRVKDQVDLIIVTMISTMMIMITIVIMTTTTITKITTTNTIHDVSFYVPHPVGIFPIRLMFDVNK